MPTRSAKAKSCSVSPPKKYSEATGRSVMNVVASDRGSTSHIDTLPITRNEARRMSGTFSRMRSNTMIVS